MNYKKKITNMDKETTYSKRDSWKFGRTVKRTDSRRSNGVQKHHEN